ncbi:MAG: PAS domain-containing protein [Gammaproteobacteria bacterium]|nr:PAS domain-containing protein [Gammaproteobacteria bacterium]
MSDDGQLPQDAERESEATQIVNAIFDATPVLIAYLDKDLNFVRVNKAYASADGQSPDDFVGKKHFDLYPNQDNERIFRQVIATGEPYTAVAKAFEYEHAPERGTSFWDWTLTPVKDRDGSVKGAVLSLLDVTSHVETSVALDRNRKELQSRVEAATDELRKSLAQKEVLLQEIHHRVKNNLAMVSAFLKLKMQGADYPPVISALRTCNERIHAMAMVHKKLYRSQDMASVHMRDFINDLVKALYSPPEHGELTIAVDADNFVLDMDVAIPCALVINELLTNALKYAFPKGWEGHGEIRIQMTQGTNGQYRLDFSDNGCGIPENVEEERNDSMGLQMIHLFASQLDGKVTLISGGGTHWCLLFPNIETQDEQKRTHDNSTG